MAAQPAHAIRLRCNTPASGAFASCNASSVAVKKKSKRSAARQAALREGVVAKAARPFGFFVKRFFSVGKGQPAKDHREEMRRLGRLWRSLSDKEKEPFKVMCSEAFAAQRAALLSRGIANARIVKEVTVQEEANGEEPGLATGQSAAQHVDKVEAWQHLSNALSVRVQDGAFFPTIVGVDKAGKPFPWMAFEYAGETLLKVLSVDGPFQPQKARNLAAQVRSALKVLHDVGICHCDLHPRNVLWQRGIERAKLVDLGMSEFWKGPLSNKELGYSVYTCAPVRCPELWAHAGKASLKSVISPKVDYWAFGCLVYHACAARTLFKPLGNSSEEKPAAIHKAIASWCEVHASLPQAARTSLGRPLGGQRSSPLQLAGKNMEHTWRARLSLAGGLTETIVSACHPVPSERTMVNTLR
ncbi:unnamed protein product [Durusdinium trenchii]|uniref:Protein kinase domain-containing protein n=1 Tax=Durusdinium trenchii TaxID=1381693 RepID=A0ABP0R818_9DINO